MRGGRPCWEGRASRWWSYLATLPQREDKLPIMWREEERGELQRSSLENRAEDDEEALELAFEAAVRLQWEFDERIRIRA